MLYAYPSILLSMQDGRFVAVSPMPRGNKTAGTVGGSGMASDAWLLLWGYVHQTGDSCSK